MKHRLFLFVCITAFFTANSQSLPKDSIENLSRFITEQIQKQKIPGISVAVIRNDSILWEDGFGFADAESKIKATAHSSYPVGSVTKTMTMAALLQLMNSKNISLDSPVNNYLHTAKISAGNYSADSITIRQLGSHTSGLSRHTFLCFEDESATCVPLPELIRKYAMPARPPGESYEYSDLGYGVLAQLITELAAKNYGSFMSSFFDQLKMKDSFTDTGFIKIKETTASYTASGKRLPLYYCPTQGEGSAYSSAHDVALFGMYYLNIFKNKTSTLNRSFTEMQRPHVPRAPGYSYGLAFHLYENYGGYRMLVHHGHNGFATTAFFVIPETNLCVAVCSNTSTGFVTEVADKVFEILLPRYDYPQLLIESAKWNIAPTAYKVDSSYIGDWRGFIRIDTTKVPFDIRFQADGDIHVRIQRQYTMLLNGVRMEGDYIRGSFRSDIPAKDAEKYSYNLHVKVKMRPGGIMNGSITVSSYGTERTNVLSWPVELKKSQR